MKIYKNCYRDHWVSPYTIAEKICFWRDIDYDEPWVKTFANVLAPACEAWMKFLNVVHPKIDYVRIDRWDTWNMDSTLSPIILAMLKQLKATKHGSPAVDDADVPPHLRYKKKQSKANPEIHKVDEGDDDLIHRRWDYVLDSMIWSFEQLTKDDWEGLYFTYTDEDDEVLGGKKLNWNKKGWEIHNAEIERGLTLFGKYFRALWD